MGLSALAKDIVICERKQQAGAVGPCAVMCGFISPQMLLPEMSPPVTADWSHWFLFYRTMSGVTCINPWHRAQSSTAAWMRHSSFLTVHCGQEGKIKNLANKRLQERDLQQGESHLEPALVPVPWSPASAWPGHVGTPYSHQLNPTWTLVLQLHNHLVQTPSFTEIGLEDFCGEF